MTRELEKVLRKEIARLEGENEEMIHRLQRCENINFKQYRQIQELNYYIRALEGADMMQR